MNAIVFKTGETIPTETSGAYREVLTTDELEIIADKHKYSLSSLLNILYGKTKINKKTVDMVNEVHNNAINKLETLKTKLAPIYIESKKAKK